MSTCENNAAFRYTWPGREESLVCSGHAITLRAVADAIALTLQLITVPKGEQTCRQQVSGVKCSACDGCGLVANDDDKTPWKYWEDLQPPANFSVVAGLVKPEVCARCDGQCYVAA